MVWGAIAYDTRSPLILIHRHPSATFVATHGRAPRSHCSTRKYSATHRKNVTRLHPTLYHPSLACSYADLSPVVHIWDHLGWRIGQLTSWVEQEACLQQLWNEMSQDIIRNLYDVLRSLRSKREYYIHKTSIHFSFFLQ
ncbi:uncharacterized protein TNCV_5113311 [Trichonephila clavipes]|nr:uncharacterized protein TNCV_5113311 [Trichonephila clavipes]